MQGQPSWDELTAAATEAMRLAYAPYSRYRVGAAALVDDGRTVVGCNVENASYPEGNCAEASALAALVAAGERRITEALVLAAGERLCSPCGGCRQRLAEFAGPDVPIHLCGPDGLRRTVTMGELLPLAFELREAWSRRVTTGELNRWFERAIDTNPPPAPGGRRIKLRYITQVKTRPPTFVVFGNRVDELPDSYRRYLVNALRRDLGIGPVPLRLSFRGSKNPFGEQRR